VVLQICRHEKYARIADKAHVGVEVIPAKRGKILAPRCKTASRLESLTRFQRWDRFWVVSWGSASLRCTPGCYLSFPSGFRNNPFGVG
jgi:hypothetical protein